MEAPTRIEVLEQGRAVVLTWEDGTVQELAAPLLRAACPCAECREPAGADRIRRLVEGPAPVEIGDARLVGSYAVNFVFRPDGHHIGIFSWDHLRTLGPP